MSSNSEIEEGTTSVTVERDAADYADEADDEDDDYGTVQHARQKISGEAERRAKKVQIFASTMADILGRGGTGGDTRHGPVLSKRKAKERSAAVVVVTSSPRAVHATATATASAALSPALSPSKSRQQVQEKEKSREERSHSRRSPAQTKTRHRRGDKRGLLAQGSRPSAETAPVCRSSSTMLAFLLLGSASGLISRPPRHGIAQPHKNE